MSIPWWLLMTIGVVILGPLIGTGIYWAACDLWDLYQETKHPFVLKTNGDKETHGVQP